MAAVALVSYSHLISATALGWTSPADLRWVFMRTIRKQSWGQGSWGVHAPAGSGLGTTHSKPAGSQQLPPEMQEGRQRVKQEAVGTEAGEQTLRDC